MTLTIYDIKAWWSSGKDAPRISVRAWCPKRRIRARTVMEKPEFDSRLCHYILPPCESYIILDNGNVHILALASQSSKQHRNNFTTAKLKFSCSVMVSLRVSLLVLCCSKVHLQCNSRFLFFNFLSDFLFRSLCTLNDLLHQRFLLSTQSKHNTSECIGVITRQF